MRRSPLVVLSLAVAAAFALSFPPAARADDAPKPETPATGKRVDPILALVERLGDHQPLDVRLAALKEAAETEDVRLVAPLGRLLKAEEVEVRLGAVTALGGNQFAETRKKSAPLLLERSKVVETAFEKDPARKPELIAILKGLHDLAQESTIEGLLDGIETGIDRDVISARAMAVANVPSAKAIEGLIGYMARRHRDGTGIRAELVKALSYATGVKGANDDDGWRAWWKDAKATFDFDAAAAERERVRAAQKAKKADGTKKKRDPTPKDGGTTTPKDGDRPTDRPADGQTPPEKAAEK